MLQSWKHFFKAFIPQKINNSWVLAGLALGSGTGVIGKKFKQTHEEENTAAIINASDVLFKGKYIENQPEWTAVRFGKGKNNNIAYSGCGIIAVYNTVAFLEGWKEPVPSYMAELIRYYESRGAVFGGRFGISPKFIKTYLADRGYAVEFVACTSQNEVERINLIGEKYPVAIVTFFNDREDITKQMHTVCITKENGIFWAHNAFSFERKAPKGAKTLAEAVDASAPAPKAVSVIGVSG